MSDRDEPFAEEVEAAYHEWLAGRAPSAGPTAAPAEKAAFVEGWEMGRVSGRASASDHPNGVTKGRGRHMSEDTTGQPLPATEAEIHRSLLVDEREYSQKLNQRLDLAYAALKAAEAVIGHCECVMVEGPYDAKRVWRKAHDAYRALMATND